MQKNSFELIQTSIYTCTKGPVTETDYAYVEIDYRGWKSYHPRQIRGLIEKGLIRCYLPQKDSKNYRSWVEKIDCVYVELTELGWEQANEYYPAPKTWSGN
jgi:hypothetical protein